jgi:phage tail-like protein
MATAPLTDPYVNFNFHVEIDGIVRASFHELTGLDSNVDVISYREGGYNTTTAKYPGIVNYSNLVLKWGVADDVDLYNWHLQWVTGDPAATRRTGSIVLLDRQGKEHHRWNFTNAWPCKWVGPSFSAESNSIAFQQVELAHEGVTMVS